MENTQEQLSYYEFRRNRKKICNLLSLSGYVQEAKEISDMMNKLLILDKGEAERRSTINNLISRCHTKWLGDYYVDNITYKEWTDIITEFKKKLNKAK